MERAVFAADSPEVESGVAHHPSKGNHEMSIKLSCVCPTHGRAHIVQEAVQSYLLQEPCGLETELLIFDDCPEQTVSCNAPGVRCVNLPEPITDLSIKFNAAVAEARGEWIAWWEDDDISLPFRLRYSLEQAQGHDYWKQGRAFGWDDGVVRCLAENLFFGNSIFRKEYFLACGGSTAGDWADGTAHNNMFAGHGKSCIANPTPETAYFIYRWAGIGGCHDSATAGNNADRFAAFRKRTLEHPKFERGNVTIKPKWRYDYAQQVRDWVRENPNG